MRRGARTFSRHLARFLHPSPLPHSTLPLTPSPIGSVTAEYKVEQKSKCDFVLANDSDADAIQAAIDADAAWVMRESTGEAAACMKIVRGKCVPDKKTGTDKVLPTVVKVVQPGLPKDDVGDVVIQVRDGTGNVPRHLSMKKLMKKKFQVSGWEVGV